MKTPVLFLIIALAFSSCEKEPANELPGEAFYTRGDVLVGFVESARLKSAFTLVNSFELEITQVSGIHYISKLPADSIDYVVDLLKTKPYLNDNRWHVRKDGDVFVTWGTGRIIVNSIMVFMDETSQADWAITTAVLKLEEHPSRIYFYLRVPAGSEIYWRNKLRNENIVSWATLNYVDGAINDI